MPAPMPDAPSLPDVYAISCEGGCTVAGHIRVRPEIHQQTAHSKRRDFSIFTLCYKREKSLTRQQTASKPPTLKERKNI